MTDCKVNGQRKEKSECNSIRVSGFEAQVDKYLADESQKDFKDKNKKVLTVHKNGKPNEKYELKDGKIVGTYEKFYENGQLHASKLYKDGLLSEEKFFYDDGKLESHSFFKPNWEFKRTQFYQNGNKKYEKEESQLNANNHSVKVKFSDYYDNGKVYSTGTKIVTPFDWGSGSFDGPILFYSNTGALVRRNEYTNGKPSGVWQSFPEGCDYYVEEVFKDGKIQNYKALESKTKRVLREVNYLPDGSTKNENTASDFKSPEKRCK